jgi:3-oxoacyl-[acyl-carrier protein] reductase
MSQRLIGKVAAVTGSGQGIGRAIAIALAKEGAKVVTNNRKPSSTSPGVLLGEYNLDSLSKDDREELLRACADLNGDAESTAKAIKDMGGEAVPFYGDVGDFKVAGQLIHTAIDKFGSIDILVNNAGTFRYGNIWDMSEETWDAVTGNKPKSYFNTMRHASPFMMKQKWGRIINCSSPSFMGRTPFHCNYCTANAGVVALTEAVSRELYPYGITCNAFTPSAWTRATVTIIARYKKMAEDGKNIPPGRADLYKKSPPVDELGPFITYLATEEAGYITGSVFQVGGGHVGLYSVPQEISTIDKKDGKWTVDELVKVVPEQLLKGYRNFAET